MCNNDSVQQMSISGLKVPSIGGLIVKCRVVNKFKVLFLIHTSATLVGSGVNNP